MKKKCFSREKNKVKSFTYFVTKINKIRKLNHSSRIIYDTLSIVNGYGS